MPLLHRGSRHAPAAATPGRLHADDRSARRRVVSFLAVSALALTAASSSAPPAAAATDDQVAAAATDAAAWLRARQDPRSGVVGCVSTEAAECRYVQPNPFGGDWSLLGLAGTGVHAADLRSGGGPSAQDWYASLWGAPDDGGYWTGLGQQQASDFARTIIVAHAAGLQPSRISPTRNLIAGLAGFYRPATAEFAAAGLTNQHMFALIALEQTAVAASPAGRGLIERVAARVEATQDASGSFSPVTDLQGAALAALCGAGRTPESRSVATGVANLLARRAGNGGFGNSSTTGWALGGLAACGISRGSAAWAAHGLESSIDALLAQQIGSGGPADERGGFPVDGVPGPRAVGNLYATQDGLRALVAPGFSVDPPGRPGGAPAVRPAPTVADGTEVPVAVVVDPGLPSDPLAFCSGVAPVGASLRVVLERLQAASKPASCVTDARWDGDRLVALNGRRALAHGGWRLSVDGDDELPARTARVGFGDVVALRLVGADPAPVEPLPVTSDPAAPDPGPSGPATSPPPNGAAPLPPGPPAQGTTPSHVASPPPAGAPRLTVSCALRPGGRAVRCAVSGPGRKTVTVSIASVRRATSASGRGTVRVVRTSSRRLSVRTRVRVRIRVGAAARTVTVRANGRRATVGL